MAQQLLIPDDQQRLCFAGNCKLSINTLSKYLTVDPIDEGKLELITTNYHFLNPLFAAFKPVGASFDSNYVQNKVSSNLHQHSKDVNIIIFLAYFMCIFCKK